MGHQASIGIPAMLGKQAHRMVRGGRRHRRAQAWDTTADWTGFQVSSDCPEHKDWNDDLVQRARSFLEVKQSTSLKL